MYVNTIIRWWEKTPFADQQCFEGAAKPNTTRPSRIAEHRKCERTANMVLRRLLC